MQTITCTEAKASGLKYYFTGKPCVRGHVAARCVRNRQCAECYKNDSKVFLKAYQKTPKYRTYQRKVRETKPWRKMLESAKYRALKKGLPFDLTEEWVRKRWHGICEMSGIEFEVGKGAPHGLSPSLDRKDPAKGYTQDNCRFILYCLNAFKGTMSDKKMFQLMDYLVTWRRNG